MNQAVDILILSNGPGELATWVKPVVQALRQQLGEDRSQVRISVVLSPCANASGQEAAIARRFPEVDRVQAAAHFFPFLLRGKTAENWDWRSHGVVLFLGGDQFFPVILGKRLGYRTVVYAEWEARWHSWIDRFGVMREDIATRADKKHAHKFTVVGDLMAEVGRGQRDEGGKRDEGGGMRDERGWRGNGEGEEDRGERGEGKDTETQRHGDGGDRGEEFRFDARNSNPLPSPPSSSPPPPSSSPSSPSPPPPTPHTLHPTPLIGFLPGSKPMKLMLGVPLSLAIADQLHQADPGIQYVFLVAPTLDLQTLATYADPRQNPIIEQQGWGAADLVEPSPLEQPYFKTRSGVQVNLWTQYPAYDLLSQCAICVTTVGANTAELGALAVPMIVVVPTQQMDVMRAWDGLPGLLANLPGVGSAFAKGINWLALRRIGLLAWPNIWAQAEVVPELVGPVQPQDVTTKVLHYLNHPEQLDAMRQTLRQIRGQSGAATKLAHLVCEELHRHPAD